MKKIGIMGGTFNPIHLGHLILAEQAYEQVGLDQVMFMPSKNPPHKPKPEEISEQQRVDMISLAIKGNPHFTISTMELDREGMTYTADTLMLLTKEQQDTKYFFIIGADSLFYIHKWKEPQVIFQLCTIIASGRDHVEREKMQQHASWLKEEYNADIILINMPTIEVSSASIRDKVALKQSIRYYLPDPVHDYIIANHLYLNRPEEDT